MRGYFEIGICNGKSAENVGTLWRSAYQLGASGIFTVGRRYPNQPSDTYKAYRHIPLREYQEFSDLLSVMPVDCVLVGIEIGGCPVQSFVHPERAIYLLGSEDRGISKSIMERCDDIISLPALRAESFNVAVAGSLVMYDRLVKS